MPFPNPPQGQPQPVNPIQVPQAQQEQKPITLSIRIVNGKVTADIVNCPLHTALKDLAERTGIIFEVRTEDNLQVTVHLNQIAMPEAIQRIAFERNTIFYYDQDKPERITMVRVFPRTKSFQQPGLVYLGTGAITKTNEDVDTPEQALKVLAGEGRAAAKEKAIEILVKNKSAEGIQALKTSMSDPVPEIRAAAIEGLVALKAQDALPGILKSLKDGHPGVRQSAVTAVALLGSAQNVKDLKPLSTDRDASVAAAAGIAMKQLSTREIK